MSSPGTAGVRQFPLMGVYLLTQQRIKNLPVYKLMNDERYLFLGPAGYWRVGPDSRTYKGTGLKYPAKNPASYPPLTGWQFWNNGWRDDDQIALDITGK